MKDMFTHRLTPTPHKRRSSPSRALSRTPLHPNQDGPSTCARPRPKIYLAPGGAVADPTRAQWRLQARDALSVEPEAEERALLNAAHAPTEAAPDGAGHAHAAPRARHALLSVCFRCTSPKPCQRRSIDGGAARVRRQTKVAPELCIISSGRTLSICDCHPCAGALIFSLSFQFTG